MERELQMDRACRGRELEGVCACLSCGGGKRGKGGETLVEGE